MLIKLVFGGLVFKTLMAPALEVDMPNNCEDTFTKIFSSALIIPLKHERKPDKEVPSNLPKIYKTIKISIINYLHFYMPYA